MRLLLIILKSMAIGIIGSVPVGPIVMLAIQRSLMKGQGAGMRCAIGAILSDTVFAAMAIFAVGITSTLLQHYSNTMRIIGGMVIAAAGISMLMDADSFEGGSDNTRYALGDIGKSIVMGFSNPGSFFWILAALTTSGISSGVISVYESAAVVFGVFSGSLLYWLGLTYFLSKKGGRFNSSFLRYSNKVFGVAILLFGLFFLVFGVMNQ